MNSPSEVSNKATKSLKWSALIELFSRLATPLVQIILAKILLPDDFGIVGIAIIVINFSQIFWDAGLSKALIQTEEPLDLAANVVFWTNIVVGGIIYLFLLIGAPWITSFMNNPGSISFLRVQGLQIVIVSLYSVQQALITRSFGFKKMFKIRVITAFLPGLVSIPMALAGFGPWSLIFGSLTGSIVNAILFWKFSSWRPAWQFNIKVAKNLLRFGGWVIGESLIAWFMIWGDNLIVSKYFGVHELGIYQLGWSIVTIVFSITLNPFLPVLFPTFSRLQHYPVLLKEYFMKVNRVVFSLCLPVGTGLLLTSSYIESIFGQKWLGLGLVIGYIGLMQGIAWLVGINSELYRAMGRPDFNTKLGLVFVAYYLPVFLITAQINFPSFIMARLIVAIISLPFHIYLCFRIIGVSPWYILKEGWTMILATLGMNLSVLCLQAILPPLSPAIIITLIVICGVVTYSFLLWLLNRTFIIYVFSIARNALAH